MRALIVFHFREIYNFCFMKRISNHLYYVGKLISKFYFITNFYILCYKTNFKFLIYDYHTRLRPNGVCGISCPAKCMHMYQTHPHFMPLSANENHKTKIGRFSVNHFINFRKFRKEKILKLIII